MIRPPVDATTALVETRTAGPAAVDALFALIYDDLRRLAGRLMRGQRASHTFQATALVHEAYVRLIDAGRTGPQDRLQFIALAASALRTILVDHARRKSAAKRGGGRPTWSLDEVLDAFEDRSTNLAALDEALRDLSASDERQGRIVELRFFGGMTTAEIAATLGVSSRTVEREWRVARAWLRRELSGDDPPRPRR